MSYKKKASVPNVQNHASYEALDDIYHSNSMDEMLVKADLHNVDLNDVVNILFLIDTTTYHHAYWQHTAKRFVAFKKLLKTLKDLPNDSQFDWLMTRVCNTLHEHELNNFKRTTPGGKQEIKNLRQVIAILENLQKAKKKKISENIHKLHT